MACARLEPGGAQRCLTRPFHIKSYTPQVPALQRMPFVAARTASKLMLRSGSRSVSQEREGTEAQPHRRREGAARGRARLSFNGLVHGTDIRGQEALGSRSVQDQHVPAVRQYGYAIRRVTRQRVRYRSLAVRKPKELRAATESLSVVGSVPLPTTTHTKACTVLAPCVCMNRDPRDIP